VYHVRFLADDDHGGTCEGEVLVCVPAHGHRPCVDQGPLYDSSAPVCEGCADLCRIEATISEVGCGDERLPAAFGRRMNRSRGLLVRAIRDGSSARRTRHLQAVAKLLHGCDAMLEKPADDHATSSACGETLRTTVRTAIGAVEDWLASPR
jgi:hypothetical protein